MSPGLHIMSVLAALTLGGITFGPLLLILFKLTTPGNPFAPLPFHEGGGGGGYGGERSPDTFEHYDSFGSDDSFGGDDDGGGE